MVLLLRLAVTRHSDKTLKRLAENNVTVTWQSDLLDESKRQVSLHDREENLVTVFGMS